MLRYVLKRLVSLVISLAVASLVIFVVIEVVPGDPAAYMLGMNAQPDTLAALREQLGLNGSIRERYLSLGGAACCRAISAHPIPIAPRWPR